jgi:hypothetical protein
MLGMKSYPQDYVDHCRSLVGSQLDAYDAVVASAGSKSKASVAEFEWRFANSMVLVLDQLFVHRLRGVEGKDGNAMNEVRLLCASIMEHGGVLVADNQIKLDPASSVLGLSAGDAVRIDIAGFRRLADAFFEAIEERFVGSAA